MRRKFLGFVLFFIFSLSTSLAFSQDHVLHVQINNIKKIKGQIVVSIYSTAEAFPKEGKAIFQKMVKVNSKEVSIDFNDLPDGEYAIALYHDENSDGVCNLNFLGFPLEAYGFSKNYKPILRAPLFKEVKLNLSENFSTCISLIH